MRDFHDPGTYSGSVPPPLGDVAIFQKKKPPKNVENWLKLVFLCLQMAIWGKAQASVVDFYESIESRLSRDTFKGISISVPHKS